MVVFWFVAGNLDAALNFDKGHKDLALEALVRIGLLMRPLCAVATPLIHRLTVFLHTANLTLESSTLGKWITRVSKLFKQCCFLARH